MTFDALNPDEKRREPHVERWLRRYSSGFAIMIGVYEKSRKNYYLKMDILPKFVGPIGAQSNDYGLYPLNFTQFAKYEYQI